MWGIEAEIDQYKVCGGELDFTFLACSKLSDDFERASIKKHLGGQSEGLWQVWVDATQLYNLNFRSINVSKFLGDLCDPDTRMLRKPFHQLATDNIKVGGGGQFALAFGNSVHGFYGGDAERQRLFTRITNFIVPTGAKVLIRDWTSTELPKLSNYFDAGMEWWGVYLFTVFDPERKLLTVISGSATD
jgi:hypothetical protein